MSQQTAQSATEAGPDPSSTRQISRRRMLLGAAAATTVGLGAGLGAYAFGIEPRWVTVERRDLTIPRLPKNLEDKRLVQISDLHVGSRVSDAYLIEQFEVVNSLQPDFVFFTGDFLDNATDWHVSKGKKLLSKFPRGKLGTACVLGNHDFGNYHKEVIENAAQSQTLMNHFADQGLNLLQDDVIEFSGLQVAGLKDYWNGGFRNGSAKDVIQAVSGSAAIVLSHNPDTVDLPIWSGYDSWVLCGHTHGGQCHFPIIGAPRLPVRNRNYVAGEYTIDGGHRLYINRGIGHTMRVRFMARPEITLFTLKRES